MPISMDVYLLFSSRKLTNSCGRPKKLLLLACWLEGTPLSGVLGYSGRGLAKAEQRWTRLTARLSHSIRTS